MNEFITGALMICIVIGACVGYCCGKSDSVEAIAAIKARSHRVADARYKCLADIITLKSIQHNLNCLVGDLKHDKEQLHHDLHAEHLAKIAVIQENGILHKGVAKLEGDLYAANKRIKVAYDKHKGLEADVRLYKADAAAWNQSKGLWCTAQPDLIKFNAKKERFFRLGYPEHKL